MVRRFYGSNTGVLDWYTTYSKAATATAGEFELMLTNTKVHKIVHISKTNQDNPSLLNAPETKHHQLHF